MAVLCCQRCMVAGTLILAYDLSSFHLPELGFSDWSITLTSHRRLWWLLCVVQSGVQSLHGGRYSHVGATLCLLGYRLIRTSTRWTVTISKVLGSCRCHVQEQRRMPDDTYFMTSDGFGTFCISGLLSLFVGLFVNNSKKIVKLCKIP